MRKARKRTKKPGHYPAETIGSKLAAEARQMANSLTEQQRADSFQQAIAMIYGPDATKAPARSRR